MKVKCSFGGWLAIMVAMLAAMPAAGIVTEAIEGGGTALVVSGSEFSADEKAALTGNTVEELWKTDSSTLVATDIAAFTGTIRVKGGVYKITENTGWGATSGKIYVEDGGTLYTTATGSADKEVHIAGAGSGSYPALVKTGCAMKLVMDADATIAFLGNWITLASTLDMGGHTLTFRYCSDGSGQRSECVWPNASNISNVGNVIIDGKGSSKSVEVTFAYNSDQMQGTNHTITVRNGELNWYLAKKNCNWSLICENDTKIGYGSSTADMMYDVMWSGPIEVKSGATLKLIPNTGRKVTVNGPISGSGTVEICKSYSGDIYLNGTNTAFTGKFQFYSGTVHVSDEFGLSSTQAANAYYGSSAVIVLAAQDAENPGGFSAAKVKELIEAKPKGCFFVGVSEGETFDYPYAMPGDFTGGLGSYGPGELRVNTTADHTQSLRFSTMTNITVTAGNDAATRVSTPANIVVSRGPVIFADAGTFMMSGSLKNNITVAGKLPPYPELTVTGQTVFGWAKDGASTPYSYIGNGSGNYGRLVIENGAVFTNGVGSGCGNWEGLSVQEYIQRPGSQVSWVFHDNDIYFGGAYSSCSYVLAGGLFTCNRWLHLSNNAGKSPSITTLRIEDGIFRKSQMDTHIGWGGGTTILYQTGGLFQQASQNLRLLSTYWNTTYANGGWSLLAVDGPQARQVHANPIIMAEATNCVAQVVLKNGGTLTVPSVIRQNLQPNNAYWLFERFNNKTYFHFDGGVFQAAWGGTELFGTNAVETAEGNWRTALDRVLVYEGGAIIDSSNNYVHVSVPLEAPEGLGVKAITLPEDYDSEGWYGGINVQILGEGEGATAVALYDSVKHRLTGVRVTSSGWGYKEGTTRAIVSMGGKAAAIECAVTLGATKDGGLTKRGSGTLLLKAANTLTGPVRVEAGTLKLANGGTLPVSSALTVLSDATLDAEGKTFTPSAFTCAGTVKANVTVGAGAKMAYSSATLAGKGGTVQGTLTIADGATLVVDDILDEKRHTLVSATTLSVDPSKITVEMAEGQVRPQRWTLDKNGNSLSLFCAKGMHLYLR